MTSTWILINKGLRLWNYPTANWPSQPVVTSLWSQGYVMVSVLRVLHLLTQTRVIIWFLPWQPIFYLPSFKSFKTRLTTHWLCWHILTIYIGFNPKLMKELHASWNKTNYKQQLKEYCWTNVLSTVSWNDYRFLLLLLTDLSCHGKEKY